MTRFMKLDLAGEKDPGLVEPPLLLHHCLDPAANEAGTTGHQHDHPFRHPAPAHGELPPGQLAPLTTFASEQLVGHLLPRCLAAAAEEKSGAAECRQLWPPEPFPPCSLLLAARPSSVFTAFARAALRVGSSSYDSLPWVQQDSLLRG